ncbi:hypothetical protein [Actinomadura sp. DC4]|uniref:hypothetical protein n=1 Tax=Actinomadura sp. DC4 TaxID=3055069 RepID=UPI0025B13AF8|nr:hypothetical protein [Actinomadura sp. DC4]MDN3358833.1 hypothetical protein [Actinomadura sp. DC4]
MTGAAPAETHGCPSQVRPGPYGPAGPTGAAAGALAAAPPIAGFRADLPGWLV